MYIAKDITVNNPLQLENIFESDHRFTICPPRISENDTYALLKSWLNQTEMVGGKENVREIREKMYLAVICSQFRIQGQ
jgi:hypothetical protein